MWGLVGVLCLCTCALAQEQRITLTVPGATPRNAIAQIAELTGEKLEVADNINLCTLVLRLDDVLLEDALSKIAEVTIGYWAKVGDRRILRLDQERTNSARAESLELMKTSIEEQNARALESLEPWETYRHKLPGLATQIGEVTAGGYTNNEWYGKLEPLRESGVESRLLVRIAAALSVDDMLDLESDERAVYSNRPTSMQRPMPAGAKAAIDQFQVEYAEWQRVAVESLQQYPVLVQPDPRLFVDVAESPPSHFVLDVIHLDYVDALMMYLHVYDDNGQQVSYATYRIPLTPTVASVQPLELPDIELTPEELQFSALMSSLYNNFLPDGRSVGEVADTYLRRLSNADTDDPISYHPGPILLKAAKQSGRNLVALIPDAAFYQMASIRSPVMPGLSGASLEQLIHQDWRCSAAQDGVWLVVAPRNPEAARKNYLRREPLARLVRSFTADRSVSLESAFRYAKEQEGGLAFRDIEARLVWLASPIASNYGADNLVSSLSESPLKFLGELSDEEFQSASTSRGVQIGLLNKDARDSLASWLFAHRNRMWGIQHSRREPVPYNEYKFDTPSWIERNASDALPRGIPAGSTLRVWTEEKVLLLFKIEDVRVVVSEIKENAGWRLLEDGATGRARDLQPTELTVVHLVFTFGPDVTVDYTLEVVPAIGARWFTLDQLPAALRDELALLRDEAAKQRESGVFDRGRSRPPPRQ